MTENQYLLRHTIICILWCNLFNLYQDLYNKPIYMSRGQRTYGYSVIYVAESFANNDFC